jgi:hypothetical protein
MRIDITTDGGFTGRGIGSVSIDSDEADDVARALAAARPSTWQREYRGRGNGNDVVNYTMTFGETTVSWNETAQVPEDQRALFDAVWAMRA